MSQFGNKFTRHYHLDSKRRSDDEEETWWFYTWSSRYRFFEIVVIALLLLILFCVCRNSGGISASVPSLSMPSMPSMQTPSLDLKTPDMPSYEPLPSEVSNVQVPLGEPYAKYVLPSAEKLTPLFKQTDEGEISANPITINDYLYYVNDTDQDYPNFVDPNTLRLIKEKAPQCHKEDCPIQNLTPLQQEHYLSWINRLTNQNYKILQKNGNYFFKK